MTTPPLFRDGVVDANDVAVAINEEALQRVLEGCREHIAERVGELLQASLVEYFLLPAERVAIFGSFSDHVVAGTERGEFRKVFYEITGRDINTIKLLHAEKITVPVVTESTLRATVMERAKEAVRLQRTGQHDASRRILESIAPFADTMDRAAGDPKVVTAT